MDSNDNDVVIVDSTSNDYIPSVPEEEEKPLMMLFKRLIGNDSKQNTVLTNAQIIDILHKEFDMDILYIHELEIDIYLNILKRFLKDWPQWDEFDSAINRLKNQNNTAKINKLLETNYESLKAYLQKTLKTVEPILKKTIQEVKQSISKDTATEDDIVMTLSCTREQLNQLFYRRPHPYYNNTIFNIERAPSKISVDNRSIESMLNWPNIRIHLNFSGNFVLRRVLINVLSHVLVNKKLNNPKKEPEILKTNFQMKGSKATFTPMDPLVAVITSISNRVYDTPELQQLVQTVCNILISDLEEAPEILYNATIYRKFLSPHPYVRYLFAEVNTSSCFNGNNYDLQLEETVKPQLQFCLSKFHRWNDISSNASFLKIECTFCEMSFNGPDILERVRQHFGEFHPPEPDWKCSNCKLTFKMDYLTQMKWKHVCVPRTDDDED